MDGLDGIDISALLPPSLLLPARLSAHKYLMVCTLTVAAWDTLVLSPRTWKLMKSGEWPFLKVAYHILRYLMPVEFAIVAVAFFDTNWSLERCGRFYLFEPIVTAVLMNVASAALAVRLYAIYDKSKLVMAILGPLLFLQVVTQAICCAFYGVVPLEAGQGCITGPKHNWVGIYWLVPTVFYTATLILAVARTARYQAVKPSNLWKLFLRDSLNLYGAIWLVNMVNVLFWFIVKPTGPSDSIKTINTSITAVLTTTMTLRIILTIKGTLASGGAYAGVFSNVGSSSNPASRQGPANIQHQLSSHKPGVNVISKHSVVQPAAKGDNDWSDQDDVDVKNGYMVEDHEPAAFREKGAFEDEGRRRGVKVTVDRNFE